MRMMKIVIAVEFIIVLASRKTRFVTNWSQYYCLILCREEWSGRRRRGFDNSLGNNGLNAASIVVTQLCDLVVNCYLKIDPRQYHVSDAVSIERIISFFAVIIM